MRECYADIAQRLRTGRRFAVATLIGMRGAMPAPVGTSLLVDADGAFTGNIGAGCHEAEVIEAARAVLAGGDPRTLSFDLSDELLDGSGCGASLDVAVWIPTPGFAAIAARIAQGAQDVTFSCAGRPVTVDAKRRAVVVGATDLGAHLTAAARACDFNVTIVDPRPAFATARRHPNADRLLVAWPQDVLPELLVTASALVAIAHDAKIDVPALRCALDSNVPYIGALGSRRSQRARAQSLRALGCDRAELARIHGPIGLDVGAVSSAQIACSIVAEMLGTLSGRGGEPLRAVANALHDRGR